MLLVVAYAFVFNEIHATMGQVCHRTRAST
jgi:hypothetical protein